jgi:hypothetical protein
MNKRVILKGQALVTFIKMMPLMDGEEADQLAADQSLQEMQIDFEDCRELVQIESIECEVREVKLK